MSEPVLYFPDSIPEGTLCVKCGEPYAAMWWTGEGGEFAAIHGQAQLWCYLCALKEQIVFAEECAARIPQLKIDLEREEALRGGKKNDG